MTEGTPMVPEEFRQLNRNLMEKVLDRAASDPAWRERFLDDSEAAKSEAGFPELQSLEEVFEAAVRAQSSEGEVQGQKHVVALVTGRQRDLGAAVEAPVQISSGPARSARTLVRKDTQG